MQFRGRTEARRDESLAENRGRPQRLQTRTNFARRRGERGE